MPRLVPSLAVAVLALSVTGCVTGDRPTLAETPSTTGDPAVDAVLGRLDASRRATFTASGSFHAFSVTSRYASSSDNGSTSGVTDR